MKPNNQLKIYIGILMVLAFYASWSVIKSYPVANTLGTWFVIGIFVLLRIILGTKSTTIIDNGVEKQYRYTFVISVLAVLSVGPGAALVSMLVAYPVYSVINIVTKKIGRDIGEIFFNYAIQLLSLSGMGTLFVLLGGYAGGVRFPYNTFAILTASAANFFISNLLTIVKMKLKRKESESITQIFKKEYLWLIRYDLWQAIYGVLVYNVFQMTLLQLAGRKAGALGGTGLYQVTNTDVISLLGIITMGFIFYYPLSQRLHSFQTLIKYNKQTQEIKNLYELLQKEYDREVENIENVIVVLAKAIEAKDKYTEGHAQRVSQYAVAIGKKMNLSDQSIKTLEIGGLIHDIGKIGIPEAVLNKPGKLTDEEYEIIKKHPAVGEEICKPLQSLKNILPVIRYHHEKLDGVGYPDGLNAPRIPVEARIVVVADIFDALYSDRPYRGKMPLEKALNILREEKERNHLDGHIVDIFIDIVTTGELAVD